jgi:hypothetical protein
MGKANNIARDDEKIGIPRSYKNVENVPNSFLVILPNNISTTLEGKLFQIKTE